MTDSCVLGFPKLRSFCKTSFSILRNVKTGFRVRFWKSRHCVYCKSAGGGVTTSNIINRTTPHTQPLQQAVNLPGIERVMALRILGVTITGKLSMSKHVRDVVRKCAQSLHIIRVLCCRGITTRLCKPSTNQSL